MADKGDFSDGFKITELPAASAGAILPGSHQQREIPRHDGCHHAQRFAGNQAQFMIRGRRDFAIDFIHGLSGPVQATNAGRYINGQRIGDRLAHIDGFKQGQLFGMLFNQ